MRSFLRWTPSLVGIVARAIALVGAVAVALITHPGISATQAAIAGLLMTPIVVLASRLERHDAEGWGLALESAGVLALAATWAPRWWLLPYLLVPMVIYARRRGWRGTLAAQCALLIVVLGVSMLGRGDTSMPLSWTGFWVLAILGAASLAAAMRGEPAPVSTLTEPAYADAHRLLSELNLVARQLSLGLDPHTLATALVEELQGITPDSSATVLVRSAGGRFVPVVGDSPNPLTESVVLDAWVSADVVRRSRSGVTVLAMPLRMGERVVAVAVLADATGAGALGDDTVAACREVISQAGPRLASALLFDDVRRLATVNERHRLAREIHDGIAQDMASVGYQIDDIASDAPPHVCERLRALREHLTDLVSELRLSIFDLRAGVDQDIGLSRTLADYVQRVGKQSGLVVHLAADESPLRLSLATEVELLRIVQEAVTNVRRHAHASHIWLSTTIDPPCAYVSVMDDGTGLGDASPDSVGITGMRERAARIGARLSVRNRPDGPGTLVEIILEPRRVTTLSSSTITHTDH